MISSNPPAAAPFLELKRLAEPSNDEFVESKKIIDELFNFVKWVFGRDGIGSLQMLAFGDCSYDCSFKDNHILLCKDPSKERGFPPVSSSDSELQALVGRNMDFLGSCPRLES
jgi:hypothetical protein